MLRVTEHKQVKFSVFDAHIMASSNDRLIMMEKRSNFSIWKIKEREFTGNLLTVWKLETDCLPEIAWLVIEDSNGTKLARTFN